MKPPAIPLLRESIIPISLDLATVLRLVSPVLRKNTMNPSSKNKAVVRE